MRCVWYKCTLNGVHWLYRLQIRNFGNNLKSNGLICQGFCCLYVYIYVTSIGSATKLLVPFTLCIWIRMIREVFVLEKYHIARNFRGFC